MLATQDRTLEQSQRIQVEMENNRMVKIRVESHDSNLGWYTSASLNLPLHQLALLEQAIEEMRRGNDAVESGEGNIVPFPG